MTIKMAAAGSPVESTELKIKDLTRTTQLDKLNNYNNNILTSLNNIQQSRPLSVMNGKRESISTANQARPITVIDSLTDVQTAE